MPGTESKCPKCAGVMTAGYLLDRGHFNAPSMATWGDGEWSLPTKTKLGWFRNPLRDKQRPITGVRCVSCGFIEFYAQ
jgi:hypothetical protein